MVQLGILGNDYRLKELEAERRMQGINGDNEINVIKFRVEVRYRICSNKMLSMICSLRCKYHHLIHVVTKGPKLLFPEDLVLTQHLRSVEMSQQSRQAPATSSNNPESSYEPKGPVGRLRNDHGVPTETRTYFYGGDLEPPAFSLHSYQTWDG